MELWSLDSAFNGLAVVDSYSSLIWTERYKTAGDFQLNSGDIAATIDALPLESYVTLRDSSVPMLVESYTIEKKDGASPTIAVAGRSFEACALERRVSVKDPLVSGTTRAAWGITATKQSDAAYLALRIVLGDIAVTPPVVTALTAVAPAISVLDAIPEISLTLPDDYGADAWSSTDSYSQYDIVFSAGSYYVATALSPNVNKIPASNPTYWSTGTTSYDIAADVLYTTVMALIVAGNHGIKSVRPLDGSGKVGIEIYNGADLTDEVVFDARFDQLDDAKYLLSKLGSTNVAYVYGVAAAGGAKVLKTTAPEPSGLARRVLLVDASSDTTASSQAILQSRGLVALYQNNETALFDGEIAVQVATGYNQVYFLGDIIKLVGEYDLFEYVRVVEFIRSSDDTGEKSYPTLEVVS